MESTVDERFGVEMNKPPLKRARSKGIKNNSLEGKIHLFNLFKDYNRVKYPDLDTNQVMKAPNLPKKEVIVNYNEIIKPYREKGVSEESIATAESLACFYTAIQHFDYITADMCHGGVPILFCWKLKHIGRNFKTPEALSNYYRKDIDKLKGIIEGCPEECLFFVAVYSYNNSKPERSGWNTLDLRPSPKQKKAQMMLSDDIFRFIDLKFKKENVRNELKSEIKSILSG